MAAVSLSAMSLGVPAFMLSKVLAPAFYARQDTKTPMRAAIWTVAVNVALTIVFTLPLWLYQVQGAHGGIALATALAGIANAWLLWRALRRAGIYRPQPGWGRFWLRLVVACVAMAVTVLALRLWLGEWTALASIWQRVGALMGVIAAGGMVYMGALWLAGVRVGDLRH